MLKDTVELIPHGSFACSNCGDIKPDRDPRDGEFMKTARAYELCSLECAIDEPGKLEKIIADVDREVAALNRIKADQARLLNEASADMDSVVRHIQAAGASVRLAVCA